jgi:hypothetical protein
MKRIKSMKTKLRSKLPKKPSKLIRLALRDLEKTEVDSNYCVYMPVWHQPDGRSGVCYVCFAGAVMAKRFKLPPDIDVSPASITRLGFTFEDRYRLQALNLFRTGSVAEALATLGLERPARLRAGYNIADYDFDPKKFHKQMHKLADRLEKHGL